jgi:glycine/D-amino acid oxidase-like deaminating enzyme/Fe-S-cluster-containing hydrogenase component 2/bacterioferritin-associated ferredoxin
MVVGEIGYTIATALHRAGFPIHSHSFDGRERSLACGIGKCGACEMLVDGQIKRICITKVDGVKKVEEIPANYLPYPSHVVTSHESKILKTSVVIIGAGPAGLSCREELNKHAIPNLVIDSNDRIGGQFNMQTHQFFFFEQEQHYGGMRGFDIANSLAGNNQDGILLNTTVWDILEGKRVAVKNMLTQHVFYVDAEYIVVATGAVPFMPSFENDDLPGVYTAAVVQKMMNIEHTLLGKRVLSIGAGNIGYLTSYQLVQAGARVRAIIEAMPHEGGFPVQAHRVRRLGIPILTSHLLLRAIPNAEHTGIIGAVVAHCQDFKPVPGTEKIIEDIDLINICTGLIPDDALLVKARTVFGLQAWGAGDAVQVGEGTCAVLRGQQVALEIAMKCGKKIPLARYLVLSKGYLDSRQSPVKVLDCSRKPSPERMNCKKGFAVINCLYGFACNPCTFACPHGAISKNSTADVPTIDYDRCTGCMECISHCPGLAIFGYRIDKQWVFLPFEYEAEENAEVVVVNDNGDIVGNGVIEKIIHKPNLTHLARVKVHNLTGEALTQVTGFILQTQLPVPVHKIPADKTQLPPAKSYICHCEDITADTILKAIGDRKIFSYEELKHVTRMGFGACRGKRCLPRVVQLLRANGITITGEATPRAPLATPLTLGELCPTLSPEVVLTYPNYPTTTRVQSDIFIAGGGIAGSALFRYFSEAGQKTVLCNAEKGSSWRNIAGGRPAFSVPEIADIAKHNMQIFKEIQNKTNINYHPIRYVGFAHDTQTCKNLEASMAWSDAFMIEPSDFQKEISPYFNPHLSTYKAALITRDCWQATPGLVLDYLRHVGASRGGVLLEDTKVVSVHRDNDNFVVLVLTHDKQYIEYYCKHFVNALGSNAATFAQQMGIDTGLFPVKHQAFITRRLPLIGKDGNNMDMLIDRRHYKGFSAVYGQQLRETGQIIGCASPDSDPMEACKDLKINNKEFLEICAEVFTAWIPMLRSIPLQATWAGYYIEPRYIVDPDVGILAGLRGHGFMLGQYFAKLYVDKYMQQPVPAYMNRLSLKGDGLAETAFK